MLKKIILFLLLVSIAAGGYYYYQNYYKSAEKDTSIMLPVKKGAFEINVMATGELQAARSEKILGPQGMRSVGIFQTTISDIVSEGTIVAKGGYVATLDRTDLGNKMKSVSSDIEKAEAQIVQAQLDTAIEMRGLRVQMSNLGFSMEEKRLEAKMNIYEPPAIQRQIQLEIERLQREQIQSEENYSLKKEQAQAKIKEITATLEQHQNQLKLMSDLSDDFLVKAPLPGMVIYARSWNGKKGPGSKITPWDPVVAQLPDLTDMISVTYVNEVDISKVKISQPVDITIDAFPDNSYRGTVKSIANIGEQRPNFDAKVFEVKIQVERSDSTLRPAMTTANKITTKTFDDVLFIPLEGLHSNDSLSYVFIKDNAGSWAKQEVISGLSNDNEVIIKAGLVKDQEVALTVPLDADDILVDLLSDEVRKKYAVKKTPPASSQPPDMPKNLPKNVKDFLKNF